MKSLKSSEIDPKKLRISKVCAPFKAGTKSITKIELEYGNGALNILGPKLYCPFGLGQFPKQEEVTKYTKVKYSIQMNFKGYKEGFENASSVESLYTLFDEIDLELTTQLMQKSGEFCNEQTTDFKIIDKMYQRIIQPGKEEYDPFFRLKLPTNYKKTTDFKCGFVDEHSKDIKLDTKTLGPYIEERRWIRPIITLDCLWYIEGKIYPNVEGHILKIYSEKEKKKEVKKKGSATKSKGKPKKKAQNQIEFV